MLDLEIREVPDGLIIAVQAQPGSSRNSINGIHNHRLKVAVTQVAEKGKANQEIVKLLAKTFGLAKSQLEVISGEVSSKKSILIRGLTLASLTTALEPFAK